MRSQQFQDFPVNSMDFVGTVRRYVRILATNSGLGSECSERAALIATELSTNLARHGRDGQVLVGLAQIKSMGAIDIIAVDSGPGMKDVEQTLLHQGASASGPLVRGLRAVQRLSQEFDIYSEPEKGSTVFARVWPHGKQLEKSQFRFGAVMVPKPGECRSGDGWAVSETQTDLYVLMVDALGHGPLAADVAELVLYNFLSRAPGGAGHSLRLMHDRLHGTRGAAVSVAKIDKQTGKVAYSGLGNIAAHIESAYARIGMASKPGIVGNQTQTIREYSYDGMAQGFLVMNTDGLRSCNELKDLIFHHPALIAGTLYARLKRGTDDACVLVIQDRISHDQETQIDEFETIPDFTLELSGLERTN